MLTSKTAGGAFSLLTYYKTVVKGKTIAARDFLPLLNRICSTSAYIT